MFLVVLFWGFMISVSYNAILTSVLTYSSPPELIENLEEMLHSKEYTLVFRNVGTAWLYFKGAPQNSTGNIFISSSVIINESVHLSALISMVTFV